MSSFGEELRRERELRQISLREISEATKINIRYLEALERNDFRHLPGGVFNKGFVRAYAQFIGVDPEAMVNAYLLEAQAQTSDVPPADGEVVRRKPQPPEEPTAAPSGGAHPARRILLIAGLVLVVAVAGWLAYWAWQNVAAEPEPGPTAREATTETGGEPDPAETTEDESRAQSEEADIEPPPRENDGPDPGEEPPVADTAEPPRQSSQVLVARLSLERETSGSINCDNRRVEILDGLTPGTELSFECERFLLVSAADGGALRVGLDGLPMTPLGRDGAPVTDQRFVPNRDGG